MIADNVKRQFITPKQQTNDDNQIQTVLQLKDLQLKDLRLTT